MDKCMKMSRKELYQYTQQNELLFMHSNDATRRKGWMCDAIQKNLYKAVKFINWHTSVDEAIQVRFQTGETYYMNCEDLSPVDSSLLEKPKESFFFEPENLCL